MTLSAIKSMFVPGDYWKVEYSNSDLVKARPFRQVHKIASSELIWRIGSADKFHTPWPKASEIISAETGLLVFKYTDHTQQFTFTRLVSPEDIQEAAAHITACAKADAEHRDKQKREREETKARIEAEARKTRENKFRDLQPVTAWELIDALRENDIFISPGTVGALRKKIHEVTENGWSYVAKNKPRFTYECQPSVLYMKVHDHLLLQDLAAPCEPTAPDADLDHLFGIKPGANVTPRPLMNEAVTTSVLDLFAA